MFSDKCLQDKVYSTECYLLNLFALITAYDKRKYKEMSGTYQTHLCCYHPCLRIYLKNLIAKAI